MKNYKKPIIANKNFLSGLFPAIVGPIVGLTKIGAPLLLALSPALANSRKGDNIIDSTHTSALTARKNFEFG